MSLQPIEPPGQGSSPLFIPSAHLAVTTQVPPLEVAQEGDFRSMPVCHDVTLPDSHFDSFLGSFAIPEGKGPEPP